MWGPTGGKSFWSPLLRGEPSSAAAVQPEEMEPPVSLQVEGKGTANGWRPCAQKLTPQTDNLPCRTLLGSDRCGPLLVFLLRESSVCAQRGWTSAAHRPAFPPLILYSPLNIPGYLSVHWERQQRLSELELKKKSETRVRIIYAWFNRVLLMFWNWVWKLHWISWQ